MNFPLFLFPQTRKQCASTALQGTGGALDRTGVALQRTGGALERTDGAKDRTWLGGFPDFLRFRFLDFMNFGEDQGDSGKCVMKDTFIC